MPVRHILAIDQGTTSTRAIVFDASGRPVASAQKELPQIFPKPGWVEHDPEEIWSATVEVCRGALAKAKLDAKALAGRFGDGESVLELGADGTYVQTLQAGGNAISTDGTWNAVGGDGLLLDPNSKSAEDVHFQVVSNDELRSDDGSRTFRRVVGQ